MIWDDPHRAMHVLAQLCIRIFCSTKNQTPTNLLSDLIGETKIFNHHQFHEYCTFNSCFVVSYLGAMRLLSNINTQKQKYTVVVSSPRLSIS